MLNETKTSRWWVWTALVASVVLVNSVIGQDTKSADKAGEKAAATESTSAAPATDAAKAPADTAATKSDENASPAKNAPPTTSPPAAGDVKAEAAPPAENAEISKAPAGSTPPASITTEDKSNTTSPTGAGKTDDSLASKAKQAAGGAATPSGKVPWNPWVLFLVLVGLFVVPIMIGNYLAGLWRMPDHAWKMSLTLGILAASLLICIFGQFKFGPDLAGGITLIYEVQDADAAAKDAPKTPNVTTLASRGGSEGMTKLVDALKKRLDPSGTKEITIRNYGNTAVEIIIPQVGPDEMDYVKEMITKMGQLEFRITADAEISKDKLAIEAAKALPPSKQDVMLSDRLVARWVPYDVNELGKVDRKDLFVKRMGVAQTPEVLVLIDPYNVTGAHLKSASKGVDEHGGPCVEFVFDSVGANNFEKLTGHNLPNEATGKKRLLGILLDGTLTQAPSINSTISSRGQISGSMSDRDVQLYVEVLDAGSLPARLNKTPISQEIISPTLGGETVNQGKRAIAASLLGVVIFMLLYYRFAGFVACLALTLNLIMVLALMVLFKAAFTLPGLAGLALTVGMSVDTNVLIYERIREELESGAAMRMAIRNGFDRAMRAIIDTHLTTIISGIVLFYVGTDQVKGFAVTLILGIITNLFTAFFCTRLMFDIFERLGRIKKLSMAHIFHNPNFDFLRLRWVFLGLSWALIAVGMVAVYFRGSQLFDIDFVGGSSVTFALNEKTPMTLTEVRDTLKTTDLKDKNLLIVERGGKGTGYTVDSSVKKYEDVEAVIRSVFGDKLKKYSLEYQDIKPVSSPEFTGTEVKLLVNAGPEYGEDRGMSHDSLRDRLVTALAKNGHPNARITLDNSDYRPGSSLRLTTWTARIPELDEATTKTIIEDFRTALRSEALFPVASEIGGRVSGDMKFQAYLAVGISIIAMIVYLWLRFQKPTYGIAAGIALIHDVLMTVGMIALSYYIVDKVPGLAAILKIDEFQINLTIVAALLTIIGYSVNDTIVTFDRLREIKGKSPNINAKMVNDAVNQTLGRTILTVFTVFIVVVILYFYGGDGLHPFAFAFMVGVVVGTYSSIYVASPALLWLSGVSASTQSPAPEPSTRGMQPAR